MTTAGAATSLRHTPLHDVHVRAGARMVPFAGFHMPVQYTGVVEEHRAVRTAAGLFDISHMGEFEVRGPGALGAVQYLTTNDAAALSVGQVQYSLLVTPAGGIVDDLTVYRLAEDHFLLVVNASNIAKDWEWVTTRAPGAAWRDVSEATALLAVQGPRAEAIVGGLTGADVPGLRYYHCVRDRVGGVPALISRTGYTGEDGFELYVAADHAVRLWTALMEAGQAQGLRPVGLGARDTLRLEMKFALYGNDIDESTNPLEAGLGWVVKPAKGDFVGRDAIEAIRAAGVTRRLVGFEMLERAVPRQGYPLHTAAGTGRTTSGTFSPTLERGIGMGYVPAAASAVGTALEVEVRGARHPARVARTPFVPSRVKKT